MKTRKFLILSVVCLLMVLCFYKTARLLHINFTDKASEEKEEEMYAETEAISMKGTSSANFMQIKNGERGIAAYEGDYLYYNKEQAGKNMLVKLDSYTGEENVLSTGTPMKNISALDDYVAGTITIANGNDILKDYMVLVSKQGDEKEILYKTESDNITSAICSENAIYYTTESNNIYVLDLKTKEIQILVKISSNSDYPVLFSIDKGNIYYMDGTSISAYNIQESKIKTVSTAYTSILQQPVFVKDKIYIYSDLTRKELHCVDAETGNSAVVIDSKLMHKCNGIESFNVSFGYLFLNNGKEIYYANLKSPDDLQILKGFEPVDNTIFLTYDSIVSINKEASFFPINWILSQ